MATRTLATLILWAAAPALVLAATNDKPWEVSFSPDPRALIQAATSLPAEKDAVALVLYEDVRVAFDAEGRRTSTYRLVYRVDTPQAVESWATVETIWEPWHQERPDVRARVITQDGAEHWLDPTTLGEYPASESQNNLFDDRRAFRAPLPGVAVGAVVEREVVIREKSPLFAAGVVTYYSFGYVVPTLGARLVLEWPTSTQLRYVVRLMPSAEPRRTEAGGRSTLTLETGRLEPSHRSDPLVPSDVPQQPYVAFSTGNSWADLATVFSRLVDEKINLPGIEKISREAVQGAKTREETVARLVSKLRHEVRYTGVEFGEAAQIPNTPAETLKRKYGDCKDQSTLLVAMLRSVGVFAHVALLNTGPGPDIEPTLPGLGAFSHTIVYVPGMPPLWIDPTSNWARIGQIPIPDEGRLAMIAAPDTTGLVRTPEASPSDNRSIETREFFLAEEGKAKVIETTEAWGAMDSFLRRNFGEASPDNVAKMLKSYAESVYLAEDVTGIEVTKAEDLSKPYGIRLEAVRAKRGWTSSDEAGVAILLSPLLGRLPEYFTSASGEKDEENSQQPASGSQGPSKDLKTELVLPDPYVTEWHYRIVAPPGYVPQPLPKSEVLHLGPATLSKEFAVSGDGIVTANLRFDTVKRRMSREEAEGLRRGVKEIQNGEAIVIRFEQQGESHLEAGKVREALTEFRKLAALHPKEALHHTQVARALLAAGLGEAARAQAQQAITLEPNSATAHRTLAWILQHDLVGRRFKKGFDLSAAVASYRKALELNPDDTEARLDLAILLEHDADGARYSREAKLDEAIQEYKVLADKIDSSNPLFNNLPFALMWSEKFDELLEFVKKHPASPTLNAMRAVSLAATKGPEAAIKDAATALPGSEAKRDALVSAGSFLIRLRRYPEAAALLTAGAQGAERSAAILGQAELIRRTRRHEDISLSADDPRGLLMQFIAASILEKDPKRLSSFLVQDKRKEKKEKELLSSEQAHKHVSTSLQNQGVPLDVVVDLALSAMQLSVEGDDSQGYRIRVQSPGASGVTNEVFYVVKQEGQYRILDEGRSLAGVAKEVLREVDKGNLPGARRWLDWAREERPMPSGDDPFAGPPFPRFWTKGSDAGADEIRHAAASILATSEDADLAIPVLLHGREKAASEEARLRFDSALSIAYLRQDRYEEALEVAKRLMRARPDSDAAFGAVSASLSRLKRWEELEKIAEERLKRTPDDLWGMRVLARLAEQKDDYRGADRIFERLRQLGKAEAGDFNNQAWDALFIGEVNDKALETGNRAVSLGQNNSPNSLHTLACLYAEVGRTTEAREVILHAMEIQDMEEPEPPYWYVFGRIAEQFGELDAATTIYHKVKAEGREAEITNSTFRLAQKRLAVLTAEPAKHAKATQDRP